jgi:hypothetical protein
VLYDGRAMGAPALTIADMSMAAERVLTQHSTTARGPVAVVTEDPARLAPGRSVRGVRARRGRSRCGIPDRDAAEHCLREEERKSIQRGA